MTAFLASDHLAFTVALNAMRINGENLTWVVSQGVAQLAEHDLNGLCFGYGMGIEQIMNRPITGDERQAVGYFKALLTEGALLAQAGDAQGGFMDQLQGQARFDFVRVLTGPSPQQVPGSQAQMLGDQQPDADKVAQDFVAEQLSDGPFDAARISRFGPAGFFGALGINQLWLGNGERNVEFFFEGRNC